MGKNIFIILVCILLSCCKSSFDYKEADKNTLFVFFEESIETTKSYSLLKNEKEEVFKSPLFNYSFRNTKIKDFTLNCPAFFSFDDMFNNTNKSKVFTIHKNFLRNNFIIDRDYINTFGLDKVFDMLAKSSTIFVIDKSEIKDNKITLREAKLIYPIEE